MNSKSDSQPDIILAGKGRIKVNQLGHHVVDRGLGSYVSTCRQYIDGVARPISADSP